MTAGPSFAPCYRHPDRSTGIACQRCRRPICGECMEPASVGFHCPECVARGKSSVRQPRTAFGGRIRASKVPVTFILVGAVAVVYLLNLISRDRVLSLLVLSNGHVLIGQFWRMLTFGFTSGGLFHLIMIGFVLYITGRSLEGVVGGWRLAVLFVLSGVGGATLLLVIAPPTLVSVGASASVIGLLAANGVVKLKRREDVRPDVTLLVLLLAYSFLMGSLAYNWLGQLGGILVGAGVAAVLVFAPRQHRTAVQVAGMVGIAVLLLLAIGARIAL